MRLIAIDPGASKICTVCKKILPIDMFSPRSNTKRKSSCKPCRNAREASLRLANVDEKRKKEAAYRKKNKTLLNAYMREWKRNNRTRLKSQYKQKCIENPEWHAKEKARCKLKAKTLRHKEHAKKYALKNSLAAMQRVREWRKNNPERERLLRMTSKNRRRDKEGLTRKDIAATPSKIAWRINYYGGKCYICGRQYEQIDHVVPISRGGLNIAANLRPICGLCNRKKGAKKIYEYINVGC